MTIIDKYISEHYKNQTSQVMSYHLGISQDFVEKKLQDLSFINLEKLISAGNPEEEIKALLSLIQVRVSGWAVEIAKERIRILEGISELY